ncbi:hypothetical protein [Acinetobacter calcoaceticus]
MIFIGCFLLQEIDLNTYKKNLNEILRFFLYICDSFINFADLFAAVYLSDLSRFVAAVDLVYGVGTGGFVAVVDPVGFARIVDLAVYFGDLDHSLVAGVDHFFD